MDGPYEEIDLNEGEDRVVQLTVTIDRKTGKEIGSRITGPGKITPQEWRRRWILMVTRSHTMDEAVEKFFAWQREQNSIAAAAAVGGPAQK